MATSTPAPAPAANQFVLYDERKTTNVIYQPFVAGPIIAGQTPGGPKDTVHRRRG